MFLLDKLYMMLKKEQIDKAVLKFKKIDINIVYELLTKNCWKYGIQYEVIIKTKDLIEVRLYSEREEILFKFHKTPIVFIGEYNNFIDRLRACKVRKGIYITTGVFEEIILKSHSKRFEGRKVILEDNFHFLKKQIWLKYKGKPLKFKELQFYKYLPN